LDKEDRVDKEKMQDHTVYRVLIKEDATEYPVRQLQFMILLNQSRKDDPHLG